MDNREFDELGDKIQDIIDKAINSQNYQKLNQTISQTVNKAVDTGSEALRSALNTAGAYAKKYGSYENKTQTFEEQRHRERMQAESASGTNAREAQNTLPALYKKTAGFKAKGVVMAAAGGIVAGGMGLGCLIQLAVGTLLDFNTAGLLTGGAFTMAGALAGAALLVNGCRRLGMTNRFKKYLDTLGRHTYCNFDQLSKAVGKPLKYVKKDIKAMISRGWFLEGHVDSQETCLITSDETYRQYEETKRQPELRRQEEAKQAEARQAEEAKVSPQVQEVLDRGNEYLRQLRACNDAIPGRKFRRKFPEWN